MTPPRILVAGIGNIFLGDDAFGVEVAQRLARRELPEGVRVVDFGIRGLELAYAFLDPYEAAILVDAGPRGGRPGALYVLDLAAAGPPEPGGAVPMIEAHSMDPVKVLRLAEAMGSRVGRRLLVGCEPGPIDEAGEMQMGMSEPVRAALDGAVALIESLVTRLLRGEEIEAGGDDILSGKEVGSC